MLIGIIDADLLGRRRHRFPNLACEKISGYWKEKGAEVHLLMDYFWSDSFDHVYISKVFTDTPCPFWIVESEKVHIGGTGFYFDKAPNLPDDIEHHMPDYHLYDDWIEQQVTKARIEAEKENKPFHEKNYRKQFREYTDYSIGFLTRGCFRKCQFCVNQKYNHVFLHSPLAEFFDETRPYVCLLDDNFLGFSHWKEQLDSLILLGRPFKFKQGLDERLLDDDKCKLLFSADYDGDFTFAFDNIADYDLIESKLKMIRKYSNSLNIKFYVLVGFESVDAKDIENAFVRIELLMKYQCLPYIMRYQNKNEKPWESSEHKGMYVTLARWANQPNFYKKMSFRDFCEANQRYFNPKQGLCSALRALTEFEGKHPQIAKRFFDMRYTDYSIIGKRSE